MTTPLTGDVDERNGLELSSPSFDDGGQLPDSAGYANQNANPALAIDGVPEDAESLVLVMDDPDAQPVAGHTFDHWLVWDIDPSIGEIPSDWTVDGDATEGFNDFVEQGYGGPAPPEGAHGYRFKLLALADELGMAPQVRKARLGSAIAMQSEVLAATQIVGRYDADQGTAF